MKIKLSGMMILIAVCSVIAVIPGYVKLAFEQLQDTTYYSCSYTEDEFRSIEMGMAESDVIRLLGPPLKVLLGGTECIDRETFEAGRKPPENYLFFSDTECDGSYYIRMIGITNGKVILKVADFYQD